MRCADFVGPPTYEGDLEVLRWLDGKFRLRVSDFDLPKDVEYTRSRFYGPRS